METSSKKELILLKGNINRQAKEYKKREITSQINLRGDIKTFLFLKEYYFSSYLIS